MSRNSNQEINLIEIDEIIEYCNTIYFPKIASLYTDNCINITCELKKDLKFNAVVRTSDYINYKIVLNDGIITQLLQTLISIDNQYVIDELSEIEKVIFQDVKQPISILELILYNSVLFILFHEVSHILKGHFVLHGENANKSDNILTFNERLTDKTVLDDGEIKDFVKVIELDADSTSFNLLLDSSLILLYRKNGKKSMINGVYKNSLLNVDYKNKYAELLFYSSCISIFLLEVKKDKSKRYPYPITRVYNLLESFYFNVLSKDYPFDSDELIKFLPISDDIRKKICDDILLPFFNSIDFLVEISNFYNYDLIAKHDNNEEKVYTNLADDFFKSINVNSISELKSTKLKSIEGNEYIALRIQRIILNEIIINRKIYKYE